MGTYKFTSETPRTIPSLSLEVNPGDVHDFDEPPDGNFWAEVPAQTGTTDDEKEQ